MRQLSDKASSQLSARIFIKKAVYSLNKLEIQFRTKQQQTFVSKSNHVTTVITYMSHYIHLKKTPTPEAHLNDLFNRSRRKAQKVKASLTKKDKYEDDNLSDEDIKGVSGDQVDEEERVDEDAHVDEDDQVDEDYEVDNASDVCDQLSAEEFSDEDQEEEEPEAKPKDDESATRPRTINVIIFIIIQI